LNDHYEVAELVLGLGALLILVGYLLDLFCSDRHRHFKVLLVSTAAAAFGVVRLLSLSCSPYRSQPDIVTPTHAPPPAAPCVRRARCSRWTCTRRPRRRCSLRSTQVSFPGDAESLLSDAKTLLSDAKSSLGDAKRSLGDAKSLLGDAESSLGDAESSLGDAESLLSDAKTLLSDAKSSLGDAKRSLGDATCKSSLGDAKSSRGDAKSLLGDAESSLGDA
jgi:hypothetical protein